MQPFSIFNGIVSIACATFGLVIISTGPSWNVSAVIFLLPLLISGLLMVINSNPNTNYKLFSAFIATLSSWFCVSMILLIVFKIWPSPELPHHSALLGYFIVPGLYAFVWWIGFIGPLFAISNVLPFDKIKAADFWIIPTTGTLLLLLLFMSKPYPKQYHWSEILSLLIMATGVLIASIMYAKLSAKFLK